MNDSQIDFIASLFAPCNKGSFTVKKTDKMDTFDYFIKIFYTIQNTTDNIYKPNSTICIL